MAKYSTGSGSDGGASSCELCGAESDSLSDATVAGARLQVCPSCRPHSDDRGSERTPDERDRERERKKRAAQHTAKVTPNWDGDTEHWETEGTNYDDDPLPYLVTDYGDRVEAARQEAGLQRGELAEELGVPESDLLAVEQGRATRAGVGGGLIAALEDALDVELEE